MVALMRTGGGGGGGQYDMVSASGDATLRLIYGHDVRPVNVKLIPGWNDFISELKSPAHNTVKGVHYGVSLQWGPNTLIYNTKKVHPAPNSWGVLYDKKYKGKITVPNNPIQIADAALYLSETQPSLGITDPYELTKKQFDATIALLKRQKPLVKRYWNYAADEITSFANGDVTLGATWPYQTLTLQSKKVPVKELIPKEGATGWADTWMIATKAKHVNCAYLWIKWVSTPKVQAQQAIGFGETPANTKACTFMDKLAKGSCHQYHADAPTAYFKSIKFWKTPVADCGNGKKNCVDYNQWQRAWTQVTG
jgi:putative spermidine/putrescine transport system substrate-binding protein